MLHCVRDFVRPSEAFVLDVVRSVRCTRASVACGRRWPPAETVVPAGVRVREIGRLVPGWEHGRGSRALRALLAAVAVADRAALLHAHFGYWGGHAGRVATRLGRPWVLSLHGHDLLVEDRFAPDREVLRHADAVVVPSRFLADAAREAGFASDRIRVVPAGIDVDAIPFRERCVGSDGVTVTFAGRYVEKKGGLDAVDALARVRRERPEVRAVFVGFGPLAADVRARAEQRRLEAVFRDGSQPGAVRAALAETDLLLMPSRTAADGDAESLGLVAVEAQAAGVPVVATRHGGLADAVAREAGVLVPEGDVDALADAVTALVAAPERWAAMGRAGRAHAAAHFSLADRVADLERLYTDLIAT